MISLSHFLKKALLSAFFILLTSCNSTTRWKAEKIEAVYPVECSRVYWPVENRFTDLELDIRKIGDRTQVFLNCYGLPLKSEKKLMNLIVKTEDKEETFQVYLFEGSQRMALSSEDSALLLSYLQKGITVSLKLNQYTSTIDPEGFNNL